MDKASIMFGNKDLSEDSFKKKCEETVNIIIELNEALFGEVDSYRNLGMSISWTEGGIDGWQSKTNWRQDSGAKRTAKQC